MSGHRDYFNVQSGFTALSIGTGGPGDVRYTGASDPDLMPSVSPSEALPGGNLNVSSKPF